MKYGGSNTITQTPIALAIDAARPDVVLLQGCGRVVRRTSGPILPEVECPLFTSIYHREQASSGRRGDSADPASRRESYVSSLLPAPGVKTLVLYDVHFQSPREGLSAFREVRREPWYLSGGAIEELEENVEARLSKARALGRLIRQEREPIVVAGDLNSPDASLACATLRQAGLHDAFAQAGKGYGYTYGHFLLRRRLPWLAVPWVRIDHVMLSGYLTSRACWAGTEDLSDHRPVIADIAL